MADKEKVTWKTGNNQFDTYTQHIADAIYKYLEEFAAKDEHFAECFKNENKRFEECMIYVINRVWEDPTQSPDECCYQNARHYYLENITDEECKKKKYEPRQDITKSIYDKKYKSKNSKKQELEDDDEETVEIPNKNKTKETKKKEEKPKNQGYEQVDLFSLLED